MSVHSINVNDQHQATFPNITSSNSDFDIRDNNGYILTQFENGHIKTKNFDSSVTVQTTDSNADLDFIDSSNNCILRINNGHILTKNFDSSKIKYDTDDDVDFSEIHAVAIGDSLTYGAGATGNHSWFDILTKDLLTFGSSVKLAANGAISTDKEGDTKPRIYNQINNIPQNTNLIFIMLCPNDYIVNTPVGNFEETMNMSSSSLNHTTNFAISLRLDIETMFNNHPNAKIIMLMPFHQQIQQNGTYTYNYEPYRNMMFSMAEEYGIETIDLRKTTNINIHVNYSRYMSDIAHPNDYGHSVIAKEVYKRIKNLLKY